MICHNATMVLMAHFTNLKIKNLLTCVAWRYRSFTLSFFVCMKYIAVLMGSFVSVLPLLLLLKVRRAGAVAFLLGSGTRLHS